MYFWVGNNHLYQLYRTKPNKKARPITLQCYQPQLCKLKQEIKQQKRKLYESSAYIGSKKSAMK